MEYIPVLIAFLVVALVITISGIVGVCFVTKYMTKNLARISSNIAVHGLNKIRADYKRDFTKRNF